MLNTHTVEIKSGKLNLSVEESAFSLDELCGFACRQNPKRGFLFVSKVLGKHYPVKPSKMKEIYKLLSEKIISTGNDRLLFLGFAETATGLGAGVYDEWKSKNKRESLYIHTTRYHFKDKKVLLNFQEEHSHAASHIVYTPEDVNLRKYNSLVLVDDEITTGKTMTNFITELLNLPDLSIKKINIICIKNWMSPESIQRFYDLFPQLDINFIQILKGSYEFVKNEEYICEAMPNVNGNSEDKGYLIEKNHGRFGIKDFPDYDFQLATKNIDLTKKTLVLGTGEFAHPPYLLASYLEEKGVDVVYHSTTRSPILLGNIIEHKTTFLDNYGDNISNFVYNVNPEQYEQIIICCETNNNGNFDLDKQLNATCIYFDKI